MKTSFRLIGEFKTASKARSGRALLQAIMGDIIDNPFAASEILQKYKVTATKPIDWVMYRRQPRIVAYDVYVLFANSGTTHHCAGPFAQLMTELGAVVYEDCPDTYHLSVNIDCETPNESIAKEIFEDTRLIFENEYGELIPPWADVPFYPFIPDNPPELQQDFTTSRDKDRLRSVYRTYNEMVNQNYAEEQVQLYFDTLQQLDGHGFVVGELYQDPLAMSTFIDYFVQSGRVNFADNKLAFHNIDMVDWLVGFPALLAYLKQNDCRDINVEFVQR